MSDTEVSVSTHSSCLLPPGLLVDYKQLQLLLDLTDHLLVCMCVCVCVTDLLRSESSLRLLFVASVGRWVDRSPFLLLLLLLPSSLLRSFLVPLSTFAGSSFLLCVPSSSLLLAASFLLRSSTDGVASFDRTADYMYFLFLLVALLAVWYVWEAFSLPCCAWYASDDCFVCFVDVCDFVFVCNCWSRFSGLLCVVTFLSFFFS